MLRSRRRRIKAEKKSRKKAEELSLRIVRYDIRRISLLCCSDSISLTVFLSILLTKIGGSTYATSSHATGTLRWAAPEILDLQVPEDGENPLHVSPTPRSDVYLFDRIMLQVCPATALFCSRASMSE
jgi:hypothetical protein